MALPGKLADCSDKDPLKNCEIYIVEETPQEESAKTQHVPSNTTGYPAPAVRY